MRVLGIGAHPDDLEFLCAGTLAKHAHRGDSVVMAIATDGGVGSTTLTSEEIAGLRHEEAIRAADVIGAELIWMGFPDEFLFNDRETRLRFIDAIRQARPDVMYIHSAEDYHPDHRTAGQVALDSRIPTSVPLIKTEYEPCDIPQVFIMDHTGGEGFFPEVYVDISEEMETKETMLAQHRSQDEWLQYCYGMTYIEFMRSMARTRGLQGGSRYAEGFRAVRDYPPGKGVRLLP